MAYIGKEDYSPIWLPESLPEEILATTAVEIFHAEVDRGNVADPEEPNFGFIGHDWFGPFLLSPPTHFLRGEC